MSECETVEPVAAAKIAVVNAAMSERVRLYVYQCIRMYICMHGGFFPPHTYNTVCVCVYVWLLRIDHDYILAHYTLYSIRTR